MVTDITNEYIQNYLNYVVYKHHDEKFVVVYHSEFDSNTIYATYIIEPKDRINILEEYLNRQPTGSWGSRAIFANKSPERHTILIDKSNMLMHYRIAKIKSLLDE